MRYLIFSDTHFTEKFDLKKFNFLKQLISEVDQVFINGDFWDGYMTDFNNFIKSRWSELFGLLLEKQTIYIYGNHDDISMQNDQSSLFCKKVTDSFELKIGENIFKIEHGHRIAPSIEMVYPIFKNRFSAFMGLLFEKILVRIFGRKILHVIYKSKNNKMLNWSIANLQKNEYLVCGHSHSIKFDRINRFINTGFIRYGIAQFLIIENSEINLVDKSY